MGMVCTFVFTLAVIVQYIECSSQTYGIPKSKHNPGPSSSSVSTQNSLDRTSSEEPAVRARSRSPTSKPTSITLLGYSLQELGYVRLIPHTRKDLRLEFRSYVFTSDKRIKYKTDGKRFIPVPQKEKIVLSAPNGDIFAILEYDGFLRGLYRAEKCTPRVKVNMISGEVSKLTPEEMRDCLVGRNHAIFPTSYIQDFSDKNSLQFEQNTIGERNPGSSSIASLHSPDREVPRPRSPPGRPPTYRVLGFTIKSLGYIRLVPRTNQNRQFEFRRYVIPDVSRIRVKWRGNNYMHVPTREHIVLSTSNGEVFALLEHTGVLRGIYVADKTHARTKINMINGSIEKMTQDEMNECHVGEIYPIFPRWFNKVDSDENSLQNAYH